MDMFTTVFVGNAATQILHGKMVTPRGIAAYECGGFQRYNGGAQLLPRAGGARRGGHGLCGDRAGGRGTGAAPTGITVRTGRLDAEGNDGPAARCGTFALTRPTRMPPRQRAISVRRPRQPGVNITVCCALPAPCRPAVSCWPMPPRPPRIWQSKTGNRPAGYGCQGAARLRSAGPGAAVPPGAADAGRYRGMRGSGRSRTAISLRCRGLLPRN